MAEIRVQEKKGSLTWLWLLLLVLLAALAAWYFLMGADDGRQNVDPAAGATPAAPAAAPGHRPAASMTYVRA
jgi:hypothetical protein